MSNFARYRTDLGSVLLLDLFRHLGDDAGVVSGVLEVSELVTDHLKRLRRQALAARRGKSPDVPAEDSGRNATENASQQGENMASVLDAVAAVMVKLMYETVVTGKARGVDGKPIDSCDNSHWQKAGPAASSLTRALSQGIGWEPIKSFVGRQIGQTSVRSAVDTLKASTQYAALMQGVIGRVLKEYDADSEQVARAHQLQKAVVGKEAAKKAASFGEAVMGTGRTPAGAGLGRTGRRPVRCAQGEWAHRLKRLPRGCERIVKSADRLGARAPQMSWDRRPAQ